MTARTAEDHLREEYFSLLPHIRRTAEELETEVRYLLFPIARELERHERLVVRCRVKECESAIGALRRRQELETFSNQVANLSLTSLNDLAGLRVLAFPRHRVLECDALIRARFPAWISDPVPALHESAQTLAYKYHGRCSEHALVRSEIQVLSMLIGLFWDVEHGALYKPTPRLSGIEGSEKMRARNTDVIRALCAFEEQFEVLARTSESDAHECASH
jgi:ppGpp synthetase/RelA/SpoT-type nucleotidyltranferase